MHSGSHIGRRDLDHGRVSVRLHLLAAAPRPLNGSDHDGRRDAWQVQRLRLVVAPQVAHDAGRAAAAAAGDELTAAVVLNVERRRLHHHWRISLQRRRPVSDALPRVFRRL